jgi:hypothetical protein
LKQIPKYNKCFCDTFVDVMPWPALSPCLHLIEHLCGDIQRLIEFQPMPTTTAELGAALFMVWAGIAFINHLIHSMATRTKCRPRHNIHVVLLKKVDRGSCKMSTDVVMKETHGRTKHHSVE